jgi:hypothetical protein
MSSIRSIRFTDLNPTSDQCNSQQLGHLVPTRRYRQRFGNHRSYLRWSTISRITMIQSDPSWTIV